MLTPGPTMGHGAVRSNRAFVFYASVVLLGVVLVGGAGSSLVTPLVWWVTMDRTDPQFVRDVAVSATLLVAFLAAVVQLVRPARNVAAALVLAGAVTGVSGVVLLTGGSASILLLPVFAALALAFHPSDSIVPRVADASLSRPRLLLAASAALPLAVYGGGQARRLVVGGGADAAAGLGGGMAVVALTAAVAATLAVTGTPGRRFGTWSAGFLVGTLGLASLVSRTTAGVGPVWGALAVAWAVAFVATDVSGTRDERAGGTRHEPRRRRREGD
jgi:hypothetical protein